MDVEVKFFHWPDFGKDYFAVIIVGLIDAEEIKRILRRTVDMIERSVNCDALIDLRKATCSFKTVDVYTLANEFKPNVRPLENKVALVSARDIEQYDQVLLLSSCASIWGFRVSAFYDLTQALKWLVQEM